MHIPVLLQETIDGLGVKERDIVFDGTFGGGGHSFEISKKLGKDGTLVVVDQDQDALDKGRDKLSSCAGKVYVQKGNFRNIISMLKENKLEYVDKIVLDLGLSSTQLEESGRGFSFQKDEPLLMTLYDNPKEGDLTAEEIVNTWDEENLSDIIYGYGEERSARAIARGIVRAREVEPIKTSKQLADIIAGSLPFFRVGKGIHPATKTFQALRITVNDELGALKQALTDGTKVLGSGGRIAIISFHSLEDRIVKMFFREEAKNGALKIITKRPIAPSEAEQKENRRSRSAKLRIAEKI